MPREQDERMNRIHLIGRVQVAYENLKDTMQRYREDSPRARADSTHRWSRRSGTATRFSSTQVRLRSRYQPFCFHQK